MPKKMRSGPSDHIKWKREVENLGVRRNSIRSSALTALLALLFSLLIPASPASAEAVCDQPGAIVSPRSGWEVIASPQFEGPLLPVSQLGMTFDTGISSFGIDPEQTDRLYVSSYNTVMRSDDGGCTWNELLTIRDLPVGVPNIHCPPDLQAIAWQTIEVCTYFEELDVASDGRIYVQVTQRTASIERSWYGGDLTWIVTSADQGATWQLLSGLPSADAAALQLGYGDLVVAPSDPQTIYVTRDSTPDGVLPLYTRLFVTRDGGATWKLRDPLAGKTSLGADQDIEVDPLNANRLWISLTRPGTWLDPPGSGVLMRSDDSGVTWQRMFSVLNGRQIGLAVSGGPISRVVVSYSSAPTYLSVDDGANFVELPSSPGSGEIEFLEFGRGHSLFIVYTDGDVVRWDLRRRTSTLIKAEPWNEGSGGQYRPIHVGKALLFLDECSAGFRIAIAFSCGAINRFTGRGV